MEKFVVFTEYIYGFRTTLTGNNDYFSQHH